MNNEAKLGIGVVVLAVLGGLVYVQGKKDAAVGSATATSGELPTVSGTDDLDKLEITNADKGTVELDKSGDKWTVAKPVAAAANQANVKSLLDNLKDVKIKEIIASIAPSDDLKKDYQLDADHAVHLVGYKGADKKVDLLFGKSGGRGEMVQVGGKDGVYAASGYSSYLYAREVKNWRETEIFKFDDANATSMTITNKNGAFSFTKANDHWAGTLDGKPLPAYDEDKVKNAVTAFKNLNADDFGNGKTPADTGLDTPDSTVVINLKDAAGTYKLSVGKVSTGTSHYAQKDGDPTVYTIASWASDWALADATKFEKPADAGAAAPAAGSSGMTNPMGGPKGNPSVQALPPGHPSINK